MKGCSYKIGGQSFNSYSDLLNYIDEQISLSDGKININDIKSASDMVYSKSLFQKTLIDKIDELKADYSTKREAELNAAAILNGEPSLDGAMSILDFLNTPLCGLVTPFNIEDLKKHMKLHMTSPENKNRVSEEEADKTIEDLVTFWKQLLEDSLILHLMYTSKHTRDKKSDFIDFESEFKSKLPESLKNNTAVLKKFYDRLREIYRKEKSRYPNSYTRTGINMVTEIKDTALKVLGHVDYIIVGDDGRLHLYLYKTTSESPSNWIKVKNDSYRYLLVFLKRMLEAKGINVKDMDLNIIPVLLTYDDSHAKVKNIFVHNPITMSTSSVNKNALKEYEKEIRKFIEVKNVPNTVSSETLKRGKEVAKAIFPSLNIAEDGIKASAKTWIKNAPNFDPDGIEDLVIIEVGEPDHSYDVIINGKTYKIKTKGDKERNPEILKLVEEHLHELSDDRTYSVQRLKDAIKESFEKGYPVFNKTKGLKGMATDLNSILLKYIPKINYKTKEYIKNDWELMDIPSDSGLIIFRNKKTQVIDVISLSTYDLNAKIRLSKGSNILGCYKYNNEYVDLESNWGNIEMVRAMAVLNELLPTLGDIKLGSIGVLSTISQANYIRNNISNFYLKYYMEITKVVNVENKGLNIKNNFGNYKSMDDVLYLMEEYNKIIEHKSEAELAEYENYGLDEILKLESLSKHELAEALLSMLKLIESEYYKFNDFNNYKSTLNSGGIDRDMAILYGLIGKTYFYVTGNEITRQTSSSNLERVVNIPNVLSDPNLRYVANLLQITYDNISSEFDAIYNDNIRTPFNLFYKDNGYTDVLNMSIGNLAGQFKNLYELDSKGRKTMNFKNPYLYENDSNYLKPHERELLKNVLYQIAIVTNPNLKLDINNNSKMKEYIKTHQDYLWVPLERASKATTRANPKSVIAKFKNGLKRLRNLEETFDEYVNGITPEEREMMGNDSDEFYTLSLRNPFEMSTMLGGIKEVSVINKKRKKLIEDYGVDFFETNLENILVDYYVKRIQTIQLNKFITVSKALLLQLHITGGMAGNQKVVNDEIKYIEDYIKVNVFNTSIMSKPEKAIMSVIVSIKKFATDMLLGGNVIGAGRDIIQGVLENLTRSVIKMNTDITPKNVASAYTYVTTHGTSNAMAVNLLSRLCLKYRLSNTDIGRVGERAKSGRNGILNYDNWLYSTMRGPDFLNRMTLFVAKCMQDGCWDAFSIDENNNLKYDWKKDRRFSIYAQGEKMKNHPDYKNQYEALKSLYLSKIRQYNLDHPEKPLDYTDDLPEAYSNQEILSIRSVADNIYGAYDKSKKAMFESMSVGITFAMFTTWMQGIVNNYLMKPQKNGISKLIEVQDTDELGNLLWFDENNNETTVNTGRPVLKNVPIIVEGILYSVGRLAKIMYTEGWDAVKNHYKDNITVLQNVKKLVSDLLIGGFLSILFKCFLDKDYEKYKKTAKDNPILQNLIIEILYKSTSRSYDTYKGLYNIIDFIGSNNATPVYSVPTETIRSMFNIITGDKSFETLFINNTGFGRTFKDTYKAEVKKNKE